ncbi:MAG TPA: response regulator [Bryobacteraceae bacterium]|nr:response regulator [Bryobacteraceae bacterium]
MTQALSGDALKHLRHDLRTPINHILGYTEILLEDFGESGGDQLPDTLREIHSGGRTLLEWIQQSLGESLGSVSGAQLQAFEAKLRPEAERLLRASEAVKESLHHLEGTQEALSDMERVASAFHRLLTLVRETVHGPDATPAEPASPAPIPKVQPEVPPAPVRATPDDAAGRLLIVEDNPANRDLLRRRLEKEGHQVQEAENGRQAIDRLASEEFDLMLLDIMMPEMNGFEVLARVKQNPRLNGLPVIMISALDEIQSVVRCIQMGAEDYLPKPFDPVLLRARIGASLEKKRLRDRERRKTEELEEALHRLKETQDQLVVQEKMASLGALTAGIAHEIKNPLNFVTNFAELSVDLLQDLQQALTPARGSLTPDDSSYLDELTGDLTINLQKIREHGKRADSIVRGMLAHSRGGSGQREKVDLNSLVSEAVNLAYHGLRAQDSTFNIALEAEYDKTMPQIQVMAQDLSRVILNIANNGCYAANQKRIQRGDSFRPRLRVTTSHTRDHAEIRIHDNGTGIPKNALQKIFNPFFTTKPTGVGTGLGLSLSYQIVVEQHKGNIRVNTEEGEFTEFVITLPLQPV